MVFLFHILGYFLIFWAVDVNRTVESKIELFSKEWLKMMILVLIGGLLLAK